jgi:putative spermidine/putrescine transport system permease protein
MRAMFIGHTLVALPYVFLTVSAVLVVFDRSLEEAARSLGAGPLTSFARITLPLIKGGVISGALFAFITSFDQFPISLLLVSVGNTPLPIQLFDYLRFSFDPAAAAVSTVSVLMSVAIVLLVDRLVGLQAVTWGAGRQ